jgi:hypothetical protein
VCDGGARAALAHLQPERQVLGLTLEQREREPLHVELDDAALPDLVDGNIRADLRASKSRGRAQHTREWVAQVAARRVALRAGGRRRRAP